MPRPGRGEHKEVDVPPEIQKLIKPRPGFANYYFNELNRDRVWSAFRNSGDFSASAGPWKLSGTMSGGKVEVTLGDSTSSGTFPQGAAKIDSQQDLDQQLAPEGSGGLAAALHLWRQILVQGPEKFGEVVYFGTTPHSALDGQADVLIAHRNVAELHLIFDPASGRLAAAELITDPTSDGCEVHFGDYREVNGRHFPHQWDVRRGDEPFGRIQWQSIELASSPEEKTP